MSRNVVKSNRFTEDEVNLLIKLFNEGSSFEEIAVTLNRTPKSISSKKERLQKLNPEKFKPVVETEIFRTSEELFSILSDINDRDISEEEILKSHNLKNRKELLNAKRQASRKIQELTVKPFDILSFLEEGD